MTNDEARALLFAEIDADDGLRSAHDKRAAATWLDQPSFTKRLEDAALRAIRAALAQRESGWRSMESAPRDGTKIDLWTFWPPSENDPPKGGRRIADAIWHESVRDWYAGNFYLHQYAAKPVATHWQPLPTPPASAKGAGK